MVASGITSFAAQLAATPGPLSTPRRRRGRVSAANWLRPELPLQPHARPFDHGRRFAPTQETGTMATPQQAQQQLVPHTVGDLYLKSIAKDTQTIKNIAVFFVVLT